MAHVSDRAPLLFAIGCLVLVRSAFPLAGAAGAAEPVFRAGAAAVDISPEQLPVRVSGGFLEARGDHVNDRLFARCLVMDDGSTRVAIAVVDSLMLPRELIDEAKAAAARSTGIPSDRILVAATHTHSAPAAMGCLGTDVEPDYARALQGKIVEGIELAARNL